MTTAPYSESYNNGGYGDIQPNATFTANSIDISNTQFTDVKLLCTTDTNTLKLPVTVKNFYCDSSFDLDTDYLEDGEYDVVHGELIEPYTTDYEGEVILTKNGTFEVEITDWKKGYKCHAVNNVLQENSTYQCMEHYIQVVPGSTVYLTNHTATTVGLYEYVNTNDKLVRFTSSQLINNGYRVLQADTNYIRIDANMNAEVTIKYDGVNMYTPNLIPSSADGSLIFSMYAPSNTVAPASGTWDLKGLTFDNFHTFGMNNDVKVIAEKTQNINFSEVIELDNLEFDLNIELITSANDNRGYIQLRDGYKTRVIYFNRKFIAYATNIGSWVFTKLKEDTSSSATKLKLSVREGVLTYYLDEKSFYSTNLNNIPYYDDTIYNQISIELINDGGFDKIISSKTLIMPSNDINDGVKSVTMPSRYDDYNITIKNANISPKTHNTMLYPLLVNEDNPITGTLDYTNYAGKYLSWSFAYTDEEYVNIIQPRADLLNSYEYKYNAFYDTEYEFDNPNEIARYTSSASGVLPGFNAEFTYTYDEIDNGDGTYTTKVYANSLDNLPTKIYFTSNNLLTVDKLNTSKVTTMFQMFRSCGNLTRINCRLDTSSVVNDISQIFLGCSNLEYVDATNLVGSNIKYVSSLFANCPLLKQIDGLNTWDTSNVKNMLSMFQNCSSLTTLDVSGFDTSNVTNMESMFHGCSKLTTLDLNNFNTSNVTNMYFMFHSCSNLTSLDLSGFNTGKVTNMSNMFIDCSKLKTITGLGDLDTSNVTNIDYMFTRVSALETWGLDKWDTSKIESMVQTFRASSIGNDSGIENWKLPNLKGLYFTFADCKNLTRLDISGWVTENTNDISLDASFYTSDKIEYINFENWSHIKLTKLSNTFTGCSALTEIKGIENFDTSNVTTMYQTFHNCISLTSLDLSNWDTTNVTTMNEMFKDCNNLTSLDVSGFDTSKVTNMNGMFLNCSSLTSLHVESWSLDNINTIISQLSVSPSISTLYGAVIIDESTLPSGWVYKFNNILEIARYTANASGVVPTFNNGFTGYNVNEIDNNNNTYTVSIMTDSLDNLPTSISFSDKTGLLTVDKLNTKNVTNMYNMFYSCYNLTSLDVSGFKTSKVTDMSNMFYNCRGLTSLNLSGFDTSSVTNMVNMFSNCNKLTSLNLSGLKTSNVTNMNSMFYGCSNLTSLDLTGFDTSKVTNMGSMFRTCTSLTSLDLSGLDASKVTDMGSMFYYCINLTSLDLSDFKASNVDTTYAMFQDCSKLTSLDLSGFDTSKATNMSSMFKGCSGLTLLDSMQNISLSLDLFATILDATSLLDVIDNLATVSTKQTLTLGSTLLAKLTEDQIAIAVNKGWTVS